MARWGQKSALLGPKIPKGLTASTLREGFAKRGLLGGAGRAYTKLGIRMNVDRLRAAHRGRWRAAGSSPFKILRGKMATGAFAPGHKFFGNQYLKLAGGTKFVRAGNLLQKMLRRRG